VSDVRDRRPIRLAELVAALSLGIDLGFGQPMEHVLRQCLIALRLADDIGLDDEDREAVYYSALLVNVGCHTDAHEQAKWMGDDIALKSKKYDPETSSLRQVTDMLRMVGAGSPPLHRIRTGFAFAVSGRKEFDGMIAQNARLARMLGEELDLPQRVLDGLGASYERWDGEGWPGKLAGESIPMASRNVQLAEFVEVASIRRCRRREAGGGEPIGDAVRPWSRAPALCRRGEGPRRLDSAGSWTRSSTRSRPWRSCSPRTR
jgi:hypothetical protein